MKCLPKSSLFFSFYFLFFFLMFLVKVSVLVVEGSSDENLFLV